MLTTEHHIEEVRIRGFTVLPEVLNLAELQTVSDKLDALLEADIRKFGKDYLLEVREYGTLRFLMAEDRYFLKLINVRPVMDIVEALLGPACILHLQNGILLMPDARHQQAAFHQDYRRWMNGFDLSFNAFFIVDEFTAENGATYVVPGTHLLEDKPSDEFLERYKQQVIAAAGSVLIFNSRLWHSGGVNQTNKIRRAVNHQYTVSYIRQQVDYAHCLPESEYDGEYDGMPERLQQLLGRFVRLPKSIEEFRVPPEERLHRPGQG